MRRAAPLMMLLQDFIPLGPKTTMRIGGTTRWFAELATREDVEEATLFASENKVPLIVLGGGSNTIFAEGTVEALVVRIKHEVVTVEAQEPGAPGRVTVGAGKILASLLNELAARDLDLSPLTGIPGTVGGAVFGNAGQGPGGIWIDRYVENVTAFIGGQWKNFPRDECDFRYRESGFKDSDSPIIWEAVLQVPPKPKADVLAEIDRLLTRRIETQPHLKTAGSCFKALPDGTPAWKLIDAAGLRGLTVGGVQVSEKHANFLLNAGKGTFADALAVTWKIREEVPEIAGIEMRFYGRNGEIVA